MLECLDPFFMSLHFPFFLICYLALPILLETSSSQFSVIQRFLSILSSSMEHFCCLELVFCFFVCFWYYVIGFYMEDKVDVCALVSFLILILWLSFRLSCSFNWSVHFKVKAFILCLSIYLLNYKYTLFFSFLALLSPVAPGMFSTHSGSPPHPTLLSSGSLSCIYLT